MEQFLKSTLKFSAIYVDEVNWSRDALSENRVINQSEREELRNMYLVAGVGKVDWLYFCT